MTKLTHDKCKVLLLLSGGIDSTTLLAKLVNEAHDVTALIFDYGQTLIKEVGISKRNAEHFGAAPLVMRAPLDWLPTRCTILRGNQAALANDRTPEQIAQGGTPTSYVPFRNGIFLAYAIAYGEAEGIQDIYCGGNGLFSGNYWDDTADFARAMTEAAREGTSPDYTPTIHYPWAEMSKADIVAEGIKLGVSYRYTWSCYQNGDAHCGVCDSCVQRREALAPHCITLEGEPGHD